MENRPKAPEPVYVLRGCQQVISSIDFINSETESGTVRNLASGTQEGQLMIWDLKVKAVELQWKAHDSSVLWVKYLNSSNVWTCGRNESAVLWDLSEGRTIEKKRFPLEDYLGFSRCDLIQDPLLLSTPGPSQDCVTLWDVKSAKKVSCLQPKHNKSWGSVMQCKWIQCSGSTHLLVSYENGTLALWDWSNNRILHSLNCADNPISLEFNSDLLKGVCGTASENVFFFSLNAVSQTLSCETQVSITNPGVSCVCSRSDGKLLATGGWDHRVRLFSWKKKQQCAVLLYHKNSIESLAFSHRPVESLSKGPVLAAGSADNSISLWDIYN